MGHTGAPPSGGGSLQFLENGSSSSQSQKWPPKFMSQWKLVPSVVCNCCPLVQLPTVPQGRPVFFPKQTDTGFGKEDTISIWGLSICRQEHYNLRYTAKGWKQPNSGQVGKCSCLLNCWFQYSPRPFCMHGASATHSVCPLAALCAAAFQVSYLTWEGINLPVPSSSTWFQFGRSLVARQHLLIVIFLFHISG